MSCRVIRASRYIGGHGVRGQTTAGKGGAIRRLTGALDRAATTVCRSPPDRGGAAQPYLWRFWRIFRVTAGSHFDRSVVRGGCWWSVSRVSAPRGGLDARRHRDHDFEQQITRRISWSQVRLAISKDEQLRRFKARGKSPSKLQDHRG